MGRLSMPSKRKKADVDVFTVDRVWERKKEEDGTFRYLTSWKGYAEKTWEPRDHFTEDAIELVHDLEKVLDDPANNPKPDWLVEFEELKAKGVNILKRTPGYNVKTPTANSASRASSAGPTDRRGRREASTDSRRSGRAGRAAAEIAVNYSDTVRRRGRAGSRIVGDEGTPSRAIGRSASAVHAAVAAVAPAATSPPPNPSVDSSRASTRQSDHPETDEDEEKMEQIIVKEEEKEEGPSSASTVAADDAAAKEEEEHAAVMHSSGAVMDVPEEMRQPLSISAPALASPSNLIAASPASSVLSEYKFDSAGILLPLPEEERGPDNFVPFDWAGHIEREGGEVAPKECFWKRRIGKFNNPFGAHSGKTLKVPDHDEPFTFEWCTVGVVKGVHGPWVMVHALDTDPVLTGWFMADDSCIQEFVTMSDVRLPRCKEPNKRRSTGQYKRIVDRASYDGTGNDNRVPAECFEKQLPWKNRPIANLFKVGHKLETYDPINGQGWFYPATIVEVIAAKELVKVHYDGYPESHFKTLPYNDCRLFPCGFAAAIGWKCFLHEEQNKKAEMRGRKKAPNAAGPISPAVRATTPTARRSPQPTGRSTPQPTSRRSPQPTKRRITPQPNNNNDNKKPRRSDLARASRPTARYRDQSTPDEDEDSDGGDNSHPGYLAHNSAHRTRAPAIPGLQKRIEDNKVATQPAVAVRKVVELQPEEPPAKKPARQVTPPQIEDLRESSSSRESILPVSQLRMSHSGTYATVYFNSKCNVGANIHPDAFKCVPSKMQGSLPHMWREIMQQLMNCSVTSEQFALCLPKYTLGHHTTAMSITYDGAVNSVVCHFLVPPPNMDAARNILVKILNQAGICPNAVTFDSRRTCEKCKHQEAADKNVIDILRNANLQQNQFNQQQERQQLLLQNQKAAALAQQQMQAAQVVEAQRQARMMQQIGIPHTARIVPTAPPPVQQQMRPQPPPQRQPQPLQQRQPQPPPQRQPHPPPQRQQAPAAPQPPPQRMPAPQPPQQRQHVPTHQQAGPSAPPVRPVSPLSLDDPNRLMGGGVNINTLTDAEIIEILHTLQVPKEVCDTFKRLKINCRSLQTLTEDIMVNNLKIPRVHAKGIANYIELNKIV